MTDILASRLDGSGPPLVLLNGGLMSIAAWDEIAIPLFPRFRVIRCDFRGQLLSPGPPRLTMVDHAADVVRLLGELDIDAAHLFGTSFGAAVAMLIAARHPDRVMSLGVLTATDRITRRMHGEAIALEKIARSAAAGGDGGAIFRALVPKTFSPSWLAGRPTGWLEERAALIGTFPSWWFEGLASLMAALRTLDLLDELPHVNMPTLVVGAELDQTFPLEHSRALVAAIPSARLEIIEGAGHGAVVEAPDTVRSLIESWLDEQDQLRESRGSGESSR